MYYRNAQAAVVVFDVTKAVRRASLVTLFFSQTLTSPLHGFLGISGAGQDLGQGAAAASQPQVGRRPRAPNRRSKRKTLLTGFLDRNAALSSHLPGTRSISFVRRLLATVTRRSTKRPPLRNRPRRREEKKPLRPRRPRMPNRARTTTRRRTVLTGASRVRAGGKCRARRRKSTQRSAGCSFSRRAPRRARASSRSLPRLVRFTLNRSLSNQVFR